MNLRAIVLGLILIAGLPRCGPDGPEGDEDAVLAVGAAASFEIVVREVELCGESRSFLEVETDTAGLTVEELEVPVEDLVVRIPGSLRALSDAPARSARRARPLPALRRALLPRPPPVGSAAPVLDAFCAEVGRFDAAIARRGHLELESPLLRLRLTSPGSGEILSAPSEVAVAGEPSFGTSTAGLAAAGSLEGLVIYSPGFESQAERLRAHRVASGLSTRIIAVNALPGYDASAPVPEECQGAYLSECYHLAGAYVGGLSESVVGGLFGMVSAARVGGPNPARVTDLAGIARAEIRRVKRANPNLRYVVLLGDPQRLPVRHTSRNAYGPQSGRVHTMPSDFYFQEPFRPWISTGGVNYAPSSEMVWPCGSTICATPNTDWDTRHFVWPVLYPFARTFHDPFTYGPGNYTTAELGLLIAVGRIHGRTQAEVTAYLDRLEAWDLSPRPLVGKAIVSVADAVFDKSDLLAVRGQLGAFAFFGEGFGSGYLTGNVPPVCQASRPPVNDWNAAGWNDMWGLQAQPDVCKVPDPVRPGFSLPGPGELLSYASAHGFSVMMIEGHGSSRTIGLNTNQFNKRPRRQYSTPMPFDPTDPDHDNVNIAAMGWQGDRPGGFLVSSACDPGEYLGGHTATSLMARVPSFGEYFVSTPGAGGVGALVNYLEGWYGSDPAYDVRFVTALRASHAGRNRVGDALAGTNGAILASASAGLRYQVLNRHFFGDPAAIIGSRRSIEVAE